MTGVQTCSLPICICGELALQPARGAAPRPQQPSHQRGHLQGHGPGVAHGGRIGSAKSGDPEHQRDAVAPNRRSPSSRCRTAAREPTGIPRHGQRRPLRTFPTAAATPLFRLPAAAIPPQFVPVRKNNYLTARKLPIYLPIELTVAGSRTQASTKDSQSHSKRHGEGQRWPKQQSTRTANR